MVQKATNSKIFTNTAINYPFAHCLYFQRPNDNCSPLCSVNIILVSASSRGIIIILYVMAKFTCTCFNVEYDINRNVSSPPVTSLLMKSSSFFSSIITSVCCCRLTHCKYWMYCFVIAALKRKHPDVGDVAVDSGEHPHAGETAQLTVHVCTCMWFESDSAIVHGLPRYERYLWLVFL